MTAVVSMLLVLAATWLILMGLHRWLVQPGAPLVVLPEGSGRPPAQHALSRYHARWYTASVVFLAFDVEMLFMYPWAVVAVDLGVAAIAEMFGFLGLLLLVVGWARREGAFEWA